LAEYTNPNQKGGGGGFDLSSLMFTAVIFIVFYFGLQYFFPKHPAPDQQTQSQSTQQIAASTATVSPATTASAAAAPGAHATAAPAETETVVENELYRIRFTNRGAQVSSWILKKYKDQQGQPLDLVHPETAAKFGYPLSLYTYDAGLTGRLTQPLYVASASGTLSAPNTLSFDYADGNGLVVHKVFSFDQSYVIHADTLVTQNGAPVRTLLSWPVGPNALSKARSGFGFSSSGSATEQLDTMRDDSATHVVASKVHGGDTLNGPFDWAGISDLYFGSIFMPDNPQTATLVSISNPVDVAISEKKTAPMPVLGAALGDASGHTQTRLYVGPKVLEVLKHEHASGVNGPSLEKVIDFGFFGPIAKFLFLALFFVFKHVTGNWGWAIIVLTVIINVLLLPIRISTMKSALKMQRIQPQMDQIKAKYAKYKVTDPKRQDMNAEIMKLQKDNGVNMFGGCIPNLIQLPLLIAFMSMLPKVTELRLQSWGWIPDLTAADPHHILPIMLILTSFLAQYYMPSPGVDPQQQKMMAFMMPAIFGVMFWSYASGPGLYYATSNFIMITQQVIMNRTSLGQEMREIAAKRARRKAGTGVIQGKR
jgi:YidC/Oxa1 family membrane protein insertase